MSVGSGTTGSLVFVLIHLHPLTWILLYFVYEGIARTLNANSGEWREAPQLVQDGHGLWGDSAADGAELEARSRILQRSRPAES